MKRIHMTLQGKGGVGKSLIASLLAQYYFAQQHAVTCVDADPVNATFSRYPAFLPEQIDLMEKGNIHMKRMESLIEAVLTKDTDYIIDNGAASFVAMCDYLLRYGALETLKDLKQELYIHTVITAGQGLLDTLEGFQQMARQMPEHVKLIVWLNEYWGPIESNGKTFESMKAYIDNKHRVFGIIRLPEQESLFAENMRTMLDEWLTFEEAITGDSFGMLAKQRLTMLRRDIYEQLDSILTPEQAIIITDKTLHREKTTGKA